LPFKENRFVEGFRLAGIVQWQTGNPINLATTSTYTGTANVQHPVLPAPIPYTKTYNSSGLHRVRERSAILEARQSAAIIVI